MASRKQQLPMNGHINAVQARMQSSTMPDNSILEFMQLKMSTFIAAADAEDHPDIAKALTEATKEMKERPTDALKLGAAAGNAGDMLNLAVRMITGCGAKKDVEGAYRLLTPLVLPLPGRPARVPRGVEARANSVLASTEMDHALEEMPDSMNVDALARAAMFANNAAALGFVSPAVLFAGKRAFDMGARTRASWKWPHPYKPEFEQMDYLWEALDRRTAELELEMRKQDKKVAKKPAAYSCARPGCGIIATKKAALLKCSGGCPTETKAHYCSKECQTADWKRHKPACRQRPAAQVSATAQGTNSVPPAPASSSNSIFDDPSDGKERSIVIDAPGFPGGKVTISSTTMGPAALKGFREAAEKESRS